MTWLVCVNLRQWRKIQETLAADPEDRLVLEGYPTMQGDKPVLLVQACKSVAQDRARQQAQHASAAPKEETP